MTSIIEAYHQLFTEYHTFFIILVSLFGLIVGSFLNVVAIRIPNGQSIVHPPSHCSNCKHRLSWSDLVPILSFVFLKGRCRYCKITFSSKYAIYEAITGFAYGIVAWHFGLRMELIVALVFISLLIVIVQTDLTHMIIPDKVVLFGVILGSILRIWIHTLPLWHYVIGFLVGGGVLYLIAWGSQVILRKEGMGGGDIKLFALIGIMLGFELTLFTLFVASLLGTLFGLAQMIAGVYRRDNYIPFGPFIALGAFLSYLFGNSIIQWYLAFLT